MSMSVKEMQAEYAARPYAVTMYTSHFSGTSRFNTLPEAIGYLSEQYERMRKVVARERYRALYAYRCFLILPSEIEGEEVRVRCDEFIGDTMDSY